jgi:hypothetical protein
MLTLCWSKCGAEGALVGRWIHVEAVLHSELSPEPDQLRMDASREHSECAGRPALPPDARATRPLCLQASDRTI